MPAIETLDGQAALGRRGVAERHQRAAPKGSLSMRLVNVNQVTVGKVIFLPYRSPTRWVDQMH